MLVHAIRQAAASSPAAFMGQKIRTQGTYIIDEIAQATERQDEEIDLLKQDTLARLIVVLEIVLETLPETHLEIRLLLVKQRFDCGWG